MNTYIYNIIIIVMNNVKINLSDIYLFSIVLKFICYSNIGIIAFKKIYFLLLNSK